jgi:membrane fusion protein (multidrug efflux system)
MNHSRIIVLILAVIVLSSCKHKSEKAKEKPPVLVDVIVAKNVRFPSTIEVNGEVLSQESVDLHPEINGRLTYLNIPDGASVKAGTVLAKINDADLVAQLEQQKIQYDLATKTEQRLRELLKVNGINQADYDAALSQVNTVNANIKVLNSQIDKAVVRAPFSGKLGLRVVSPGAFVTPQTLLGTLEKSDSIKVDFTVPEYYADLAKAGDTVSIQTNETDKYQTAIISAIEPQINTSSRNIKARARLKGGNISPGTFVKVHLVKEENGILVPSNALIPDASSNQVIVIKKKRGVFVKVETGVRNADQVELSSGINSGDTIVINGVLFVRPNTKVRIHSVKEQTMAGVPDSNKVAR